jgi:hypothetical protein
MADLLCDKYQSCDCPSYKPLTRQACIEDTRLDAQEKSAAWEGRHYVFDAECAARYADLVSTLKCDLSGGSNDDPGALELCHAYTCPPYHGTQGVDEPCESNLYGSTCAKGLMCLFSFCYDLCASLEGRGAKLGEVCGKRPCNLGLTCTPSAPGSDSTCQKTPEAGELCSFECSPKELVCRPVNPSSSEKRCAARGAVGEACGGDGDCLEGLYCGGVTNRACASFVPLGGACDSGVLCGANAFCDTQAKQCVADRTSGQPCITSAECLPGLACAISPGTCEPLGAPGAACTTAFDCESLFCRNHVCQPKQDDICPDLSTVTPGDAGPQDG